jgi:hypothetical protein
MSSCSSVDCLFVGVGEYQSVSPIDCCFLLNRICWRFWYIAIEFFRIWGHSLDILFLYATLMLWGTAEPIGKSSFDSQSPRFEWIDRIDLLCHKIRSSAGLFFEGPYIHRLINLRPSSIWRCWRGPWPHIQLPVCWWDACFCWWVGDGW